MLTHSLSVLAFVAVSFATQALSHFVINKAHYETLTFERTEPIMWMGILVMLIQGGLLTWLYSKLVDTFPGVWGGVGFALIMGVFLASYIAVVEPAKYQVPSVGDWFRVEASVSFVQFSTFGLLLGFIHKTWPVT